TCAAMTAPRSVTENVTTEMFVMARIGIRTADEKAASPHGGLAREGSVTVRIDAVEQRVVVAWQSWLRGWRLFPICPQWQRWRHHLYIRAGERLACRRCCELRYACRTMRNRLPLRAAKLRKKLGAPAGCCRSFRLVLGTTRRLSATIVLRANWRGAKLRSR